MKKRRAFKTDGELVLCMMNKIEIEIWVQGSVDFKGPIVDFDDNVIKIKDAYFLRENCLVYLAK